MIAGIIRWSARNVVLVSIATAFVTLLGLYAVQKVPLDAIPDLSDVQVIVYTEYPGQAPQVVEDQVTYPLTTAMLTVPKARTVRGFSFFGVSFVYVIFDDGTDVYWARSRVMESLSAAAGDLPADVTPELGPDATGVGWVYQYVLKGGDQSLADLRTLQDWYVRYGLSQASGVAEVASVGGFVKQYSVVVDPRRLQALGIPLSKVTSAIRDSNMDVGGRTLELSEREYMVRGRGYITSLEDIESIVLKNDTGVPVLLKDVARVELVPDERRGLSEVNGNGEAVSGIVLQRYGENALSVIDSVKKRLAQIAPSLPEGVSVETVYDRSALIYRAIDTLKRTLIEESLIVALVCVIFLMHARSALVAIITLPLGVLMAYICMWALGLSSNIMSLGGIAIAIGAMVDASIVMIENAHKRLEHAPPGESRSETIIEAAVEVGPALFFSLLIITVSFLPIFALEAQEGRLFKPLAYTKTFSMAAAALLSIFVVPALMILFVRGRIIPEHKNPLNRALIWIYRPVIEFVLRFRVLAVVVAIAALGVTVWPASKIGSEFMPALNEGTLFYMPTTLPGVSVTEAGKLLQTQNKIIKSFPEVESVWGKAGRAATATDPAPMEMFETVINLKPESEWRDGMTIDALTAEMDKALQFPGVSNSWTMPIKARTDMLSTGIRTPVGIKVIGRDLGEMEDLARKIEAAVRDVPGTTSAYAERATGGYYINIDPDRARLARYGLMVGDVQDVIATALGANAVTTTVEGRERYKVAVRYPRDYRNDPQAIANEVLIPTPAGGTVPLSEVATVTVAQGPTMIRTENAQLALYIFVDFRDRDIGSYVADAQKAVAETVNFPPGYYVAWSGQFEYLQRAEKRLQIVVPLTALVIFVLLYLNFGRLTETVIVMLSVPFALVGGVWFMWWLDFNFSVAAVTGFIALAGVAAETGVVMLIYLENALKERMAACEDEGRPFGPGDLHAAIVSGAVGRVRPKIMTVAAIMAGLLPILWAHGAGSEVMQRIAVPMIGGMASSTLLTLAVIPAIYSLVKGFELRRKMTSPKSHHSEVASHGV
ncbi:efflux RND transporter permease subunit [Methyloceanibacter caenitepidi]|uniref:Cobalt-zinc-cadmium resistance protein CzcA n=1 Tax=Methyloceanibacter caenitepidi TaxID=1384459 RepID=A0A0A8K6J1_9HYPH|nr:efflux RND transporter permease subunit [Methyloceanibacter caenitepidi]BAQ18535.1 cobalt-zinc-cadmium resistance protein CzcA [Methyloceanibacter caenitepidi]